MYVPSCTAINSFAVGPAPGFTADRHGKNPNVLYERLDASQFSYQWLDFGITRPANVVERERKD